MTSRCARCVGSALPPTVFTAPMGKELRATPTRTDTWDSGENFKNINTRWVIFMKSLLGNCLLLVFLLFTLGSATVAMNVVNLMSICWDRKWIVCFSCQSEARTAASCMGFLMVMTAAGWPVLPPSVWQLSSCLGRSTPATRTTTFVGSSRRCFLTLLPCF